MPQTSYSKLRYPAPSDSANTWQYWQNLAEDLDGRVVTPVANQAGRDSLTATPGLLVFRQDTGDYESYYSGAWNRVAGPIIQGKMWRTSGFSGALTAATATTIAFDAARVVGGVTFNNATDTLTLPRNGFYDLRARGYLTGSSGYNGSYRIVRVRSAVADVEVCISNLARKIDTQDEPCYAADTLPLQAGDQLYLRTFYSAGGQYWGVNEFNGVYLSATYVGPLTGAAPV